MIILRDSELPDLLNILERHIPDSLNIYHLVRNRIRQKYTWPGIEFLVDDFPNVSVSIARTAKPHQDIPPLVNGYTVFVHSISAAKLREVLDEPEVIDWNQRIGFLAIKNPETSRIIKEKCTAMGGRAIIDPESDFYVEHAMFIKFDLQNLNYRCTIPDGFRLGRLTVDHVKQITEEKHYGYPEENQQFFEYIFKHDYPTAALFNKDNIPIAYLLYRPEGCLGAGYVNPEYRGQGFYKLVSYALLEKLEAEGEKEAYADITYGNVPSIKALTGIGGQMYEGDNDYQWCEYLPPTTSPEHG